MTRAPAPAEVGGFSGWILAKQAEFYRMLSGLIRAAKADGSAAYTLLGISFLYGVFHAAGPGHGKAVISSYLVANDETWRRGIVLSFASAILQAFTAIAVVGIAAALLGATAKAMGNTVRVIEIVSYALIILIGLRLLWVKGRAFLHLLRGETHAHHGASRSIEPTRRPFRRGLGGDAGDVPARLCDGCLRDHLCGGADCRAHIADDAGHRSGVARHHAQRNLAARQAFLHPVAKGHGRLIASVSV